PLRYHRPLGDPGGLRLLSKTACCGIRGTRPGVRTPDRAGDRLLKRPVGRPSRQPKVFYHSFHYRAGSWECARRVVAKVEWHAGELFPRVGFIVTNLKWRSKRVVRFYNRRGTAGGCHAHYVPKDNLYHTG